MNRSRFLSIALLVLGQLLIVPIAYPIPQIRIGQNFNGSDNTTSLLTPADSNGAIGPQHFVEFINGQFAVYNKTNGTNILRIRDIDFWGNAGVVIPAFEAVSDPRIIFDLATQRWFASQVDFDATLSDPTQAPNHFLLAVSDTPNPAGTWHGVSFLADSKTGFFADFPTLGLDADSVYLSGDMFFFNSAVGCSLWSIPKADLLLNEIPAVITNATSFGIMDFTNRGEILQPAICFDGSGSGDVLATGNILSGDTLVASRVLDGGTANPTLPPAMIIPVDPYTYPIDPVQPDGSANLSDNEARLSSSTYTLDGILYAVQSIEVGSRAAIRWYRIAVTNQTLIEAGTITNDDLDLFFPSIAVTKNGVMLICCNGSSINVPVSSFAFVGQTINGVSAFSEQPTVLQAGTIPNYQDGGFESRWGDYSTTTPDPSDPSRFWTIQLLPYTSSTWVTQITEVMVVPELAVTTSGNSVNLSWPLFGANYQLQTTTNLLGAWSFVPQTPVTNSENISVTFPTSGSQQFFRLVDVP